MVLVVGIAKLVVLYRSNDQYNNRVLQFIDYWEPRTYIEKIHNPKMRNECNFYDDSSRKANVPNYCIKSMKPKKLMLWGDSHAEHLYYGLRKNLDNDIDILQIVGSGCQPAVGKLAESQNIWCKKMNTKALEILMY